VTYPLAPRGEQADVLHGFTVPDPYRRHGLSEITVHDLDNGDRLAALDLPGMGSVGRLSERPEGGHEAWFAYTDHTSRTGRHPEEDTMHSDIAYQLADQRHAELIAAVAHTRLVDEAEQARAGLAGRRRVVRRW